MAYTEAPTRLSGAVLWHTSGAGRARILPDGCIDLIWDGTRLFVAGPDSVARFHDHPDGVAYVGLRMAAGLGPVRLGVPACALRDSAPDLADLWPEVRVRELTERVASNPARALLAWLDDGAEADPLGAEILRLAGGGVDELASRTGLSTRHLRRRCDYLFGYGPKHLARIVRFTHALDRARGGVPLATVAAECGFADQAHLTREVRSLAGTTPTALLAEREVAADGRVASAA